jgi:hypothetical protein
MEQLVDWWRRLRYDNTLASMYSRGNTPEPVRAQYDQEEEEKIRAYEAELGETDEE